MGASLEDATAAFDRGDLTADLAIYDPGVKFMTKDGPRQGCRALHGRQPGRAPPKP